MFFIVNTLNFAVFKLLEIREMQKMKKNLGILIGLLFFTLVQVSAQTKSKSLDKVAAVVGSSIILQSEI